MNTIDWLSKLIAYDTVSRNSNLQLIHCIQDWFLSHNIGMRLTYDKDDHKANLFATIPGSEGDTQNGLILSGHTDVVPVDGQIWDSNPFEAHIVDDKIYGRGACDMKGFLAVMLALIPHFLSLKLRRPLHFAFSFDEEIGCRGAPILISDLKNLGIQPKFCVVGEPTEMQVVSGHKGIQLFQCLIHGKEAHSSLTPLGCNAIDYAAKLILFLQRLARKFKEKGTQDIHYDVPYTTLSTNIIQGGSAYNIIPHVCTCYFEFRYLPQDDANSIYETILQFINNDLLIAMQNEFSDARIDISRLSKAPSFECDAELFLEQAKKLLQDDSVHKVAYATEAGLFQEINIATIVCGPGSITEAHRANEFVAIQQLEKCEEFLKQIVYQTLC